MPPLNETAAGTHVREDGSPAPRRLGRLRLAALNIDGVLLPDSFSPMIHHFVESRGGTYTAELERRVFSQNRAQAARALAETLPGLTPDQVVAEYFRDREAYLAANPMTAVPGALELLLRLRGLGLDLVCYGGLDADHFERYLGAYAEHFGKPPYICTNDVRPGLREITEEFGLEHGEVLFVDDVASVAAAARELAAPFIGRPSTLVHSHQAAQMRGLGVRHIVASLDAIDEALVRRIDQETAEGTLWTAAAPRHR